MVCIKVGCGIKIGYKYKYEYVLIEGAVRYCKRKKILR